MEVALILVNVNKNDSDGRPKIVACEIVDTNLITAIATMPEVGGLMALSRVKFRRRFPGRRFPASFGRNAVLAQWKYNLYAERVGKRAESNGDSKNLSVQIDLNIKMALKVLAKRHHKTLSEFTEYVLTDWINQYNSGTTSCESLEMNQQFAFNVGRIARFERDMTGSFDPDKYLTGTLSKKIKAVKTYAQIVLQPDELNEFFGFLKDENLERPILPQNYGWFMAGFYNLPTEV